jgi:hypothetical protein
MSTFCLSLPLPGLGIASRALWPVWRDSTRKEVRFQPLPKRQAVKLYHHARRLERQTRVRNRQDGAIGRNGLLALHALLFDFMHYASGRLDPSIKAIARAANISERSAARGLAKLKAAGVVTWLRRCAEDWVDGRFVLRQQSNAYGLKPPTQWRGYVPPPEPPTPFAGSWGDHPAMPDALASACQQPSLAAMAATLGADPHDGLAMALARFARSVTGSKP